MSRFHHMPGIISEPWSVLLVALASELFPVCFPTVGLESDWGMQRHRSPACSWSKLDQDQSFFVLPIYRLNQTRCRNEGMPIASLPIWSWTRWLTLGGATDLHFLNWNILCLLRFVKTAKIRVLVDRSSTGCTACANSWHRRRNCAEPAHELWDALARPLAKSQPRVWPFSIRKTGLRSKRREGTI